MAAEGSPNREIVQKANLSSQMVSKWRQRYLNQGLYGIHDELHPGRPRFISGEKVAAFIRKTLKFTTSVENIMVSDEPVL